MAAGGSNITLFTWRGACAFNAQPGDTEEFTAEFPA